MAPRNTNQLAADLDRFLGVIALTFDECVDGDTLAGAACMSRFHFQRTFQRALGETPGALRRRILLERAAFQLQESRTDVTTIAFDAGYQSLEGFLRAFRRAYHVSPGHYRRLAPIRYRLTSRNGIHFSPARERHGWST